MGLPHQFLHESYLLTQHPYRCPHCRAHRTFLNPNVNPIPDCPDCLVPLIEDIPQLEEPYMQMGPYRQRITQYSTFIHDYTPDQAMDVIDSVPEYSFHWKDIKWHKVEEYAEVLSDGKWTTHGMYFHPIRFGDNGVLLTGIQRLLACYLADLPMPAWTIDYSGYWFTNGVWSPKKDALGL